MGLFDNLFVFGTLGSLGHQAQYSSLQQQMNSHIRSHQLEVINHYYDSILRQHFQKENHTKAENVIDAEFEVIEVNGKNLLDKK